MLSEKNDRKKGVDCYVCHVDCGNCVFGGQGNWVWGFVLDAVPFGSVAPMSVRPYCSICLQFNEISLTISAFFGLAGVFLLYCFRWILLIV